MSEKAKASKVTLSSESDQLLDQVVERTNTGFLGGRLTKQDALSWIVRYFWENQFDRNLERIRKDHFDRLVYVEHLLERVKQSRKKGAQNSDAELELKAMVDGGEKPRERQPRLNKSREASEELSEV